MAEMNELRTETYEAMKVIMTVITGGDPDFDETMQSLREDAEQLDDHTWLTTVATHGLNLSVSSRMVSEMPDFDEALQPDAAKRQKEAREIQNHIGRLTRAVVAEMAPMVAEKAKAQQAIIDELYGL